MNVVWYHNSESFKFLLKAMKINKKDCNLKRKKVKSKAEDKITNLTTIDIDSSKILTYSNLESMC
jgi:hypothetical protein